MVQEDQKIGLNRRVQAAEAFEDRKCEKKITTTTYN